MNLDNIDISPELKEKAKACKTPEEVLQLAAAEGYELSDEELSSISGGSWICDAHDPHCEGYCYRLNTI